MCWRATRIIFKQKQATQLTLKKQLQRKLQRID